VEEPALGGVSRTSPWLFEGGPENSLARGHDDVLIDPTLELDFWNGRQNGDDEPEGLRSCRRRSGWGVAHIEAFGKAHRPSGVRAIVDLSDDVVVSPHALTMVKQKRGQADGSTRAPVCRKGGEVRKAAKRTRVALDTFTGPDREGKTMAKVQRIGTEDSHCVGSHRHHITS
jgi:hypothetical protein